MPPSSCAHVAATAGDEAPAARDHPRQEAHARQPLADRPPLALAVRRRPPPEPRLQPVLGGPGSGPRGPAPASRRSGSRHHQRRLQRPRLRALGGERPRGRREPEAEPPARAEARRHPRPRLRGLLRPVRSRRLRARAGDLRRAAPGPARGLARALGPGDPPLRARPDAGSQLLLRRDVGPRRPGHEGLDSPRGAPVVGDRAPARGVLARGAARDLPPRGAPPPPRRGTPAPGGQPRGDVAPGRPRAPAADDPGAAGWLPRLPARLHRPRDVGRPPARELLLERLPERLVLAGELPALPAGGELRPPEGGPRGERPDLHRHGDGLPGPRDRARHRLRAPRPHGLAGPRPRLLEEEWGGIFRRRGRARA